MISSVPWPLCSTTLSPPLLTRNVSPPRPPIRVSSPPLPTNFSLESKPVSVSPEAVPVSVRAAAGVDDQLPVGAGGGAGSGFEPVAGLVAPPDKVLTLTSST